MATVPISDYFVVCFLGPHMKCTWCYHFSKFVKIVSIFFKLCNSAIWLENAYSRPFKEFWGDLTHKWGIQLTRPLKVCVFRNWFLFCLLAVLDPCLLSPYPDHLVPHLWNFQTVLWNKLPHSFLIHVLFFHPLITLYTSDPYCHHHHFHHQSLLLFSL